MNELRDIRTKTIKGEKPDAVIIKGAELDDIKQRFIIKTNKDLEMERK